MNDSADTPDLDNEELSYEAAREELVQVVAKLESGEASLAESMQPVSNGSTAPVPRWTPPGPLTMPRTDRHATFPVTAPLFDSP